MTDQKNTRNFGDPIGEHVRIYQRSKMWYANYQHDGKQIRESLKTRNKKQAVAEAMKIEVRIQEGTHQLKQETKSIEEAKQLYLDQLKVNGRSKKTIGKYTLVMGRILNLATKLCRTKLSHINLLFVDQYKIARAKEALAVEKKPPSLQTIHDEVTIIRSFINFCLCRKLIIVDPLAGLVNHDPKPTEQPCWTWDQVQTILHSCSDHIRPPLTILACSGMRVGEMQFLTWDDIDFQHKVIHIRPKDDWTPKTKDQRAVPMSQELEGLFRTLPKISRWVVTMPLTKQQHVAGKQWTERRLLERLKILLKKLGLHGHLHTFRHSFISYSISQGISEAQVRAWVGHVDAEILRHYTHIHSRESQEAMNRLMKPISHRHEKGGDEKITA